MKFIKTSLVSSSIIAVHFMGCTKDRRQLGGGGGGLQQDVFGSLLEIKGTKAPVGSGGLIDIKPMSGTKSQFKSWEMPVGPSRDLEFAGGKIREQQDMILRFKTFLNDGAVDALKRIILTRANLLRDDDMDFVNCGKYVGPLTFQRNKIQDPKRVCALFQLIKEYATGTMGPRLVMSIGDRHLTVSFDSGNEMESARVSDLKSWVLPVPHKYDIEAVENIIENNIARLIGIFEHFRDPAVQEEVLSFAAAPIVIQSDSGLSIECAKEVGTVTLSKSRIELNDETNYCGYLSIFAKQIFDNLDRMASSDLRNGGPH
jgi:hypothetical protein